MGNTLGCLKVNKQNRAVPNPIPDSAKQKKASSNVGLFNKISKKSENVHVLPKIREKQTVKSSIQTQKMIKRMKVIETGSMISPRADGPSQRLFFNKHQKLIEEETSPMPDKRHDPQKDYQNAYLESVMKFQSHILEEIEHLRKALRDSRTENEGLRKSNEKLTIQLMKRSKQLSKISSVSFVGENFSIPSIKNHQMSSQLLKIDEDPNQKLHNTSSPVNRSRDFPAVSQLSSESSDRINVVQQVRSNQKDNQPKFFSNKSIPKTTNNNKLISSRKGDNSLESPASMNLKAFGTSKSFYDPNRRVKCSNRFSNDSNRKSLNRTMNDNSQGFMRNKQVTVSQYHPSRVDYKIPQNTSIQSMNIGQKSKESLGENINKLRPQLRKISDEPKKSVSPSKKRSQSGAKFFEMKSFYAQQSDSFMSQRKVFKCPGTDEFAPSKSPSESRRGTSQHPSTQNPVLSPPKLSNVALSFNLEELQKESQNSQRRRNTKISYGFTPLNKQIINKTAFFAKNATENSKNRSGTVIKSKSKIDQMVSMRKIINFKEKKNYNKSTYKKVIMVKRTQSPSLQESELPNQSNSKATFSFPWNQSEGQKFKSSLKEGRHSLPVYEKDTEQEMVSFQADSSVKENTLESESQKNLKQIRSKTQVFPKVQKVISESSSLRSSSLEVDNHLKKLISRSQLRPIYNKSDSKTHNRKIIQ